MTPTTAARSSNRRSTVATCAWRWSATTSRRLALVSAPSRPLVHGTERSTHVERVIHTLLDRCARGLGLEAGR